MNRGLPKRANPRDNMSAGELSAVCLSEYAAKDEIEVENLRGTDCCAKASRMSGVIIRQALDVIREPPIDPTGAP
jgi:hypothetical protein